MDRNKLSAQLQAIADAAEQMRVRLQDLPDEQADLRKELHHLFSQLDHFQTAYQDAERVSEQRVEQRRTATQELHEANEHLRIIFDSIKDHAVFTLDLDLQITSWNTGAERMFGWQEEEIVGKPGALIFTPEDRENQQPEKEKQQALEKGYALDKRWHLCKDGSRFFADGTLRQLLDRDGNVHGFVKVTRDATADVARQQAEAVVAADLSDMQILHAMSLHLFAQDDPQVFYEAILAAAITLARADAGTVQIHDESKNELILAASYGFDTDMTTYFQRVDASSRTCCGIAFATGKRAYVDFDVPASDDPDGSLRKHFEAGYLSAQATPLMTRSGKTIGMYSTHWRKHHRPDDRELRFLDLLARQAADLIERQQIEQALRESEQQQRRLIEEIELERNRLATIVDYLPVGIWLTNTEGRVLSTNRRASEIWAGSIPLSEDIESYQVYRTWSPETGQEIQPEEMPLSRVLDTRQPVTNIEMRIQRFDGSIGTILASAAPIFDQQGHLIGAVGVSQDISERKQAEEALRANQARQAFLLKLSDALRPLADPVTILEVATHVLGKELNVQRVLYVEMDADDIHLTIERDYHIPDAPSILGHYRLDDFGPSMMNELRAGRMLAVADIWKRSELTAEDLASYTAMNVTAHVTVPLVKEKRLVALLSVHSWTSRQWTADEISLIEETAERTWAAVERARAEEAVVQQERRTTEILETIGDVFYALDKDFHLTYLNRRAEETWGIRREELLGKHIWTVFPAAVSSEPYQYHLQVMNERRPVQFETMSPVLHHWIEVSIYPREGGGLAVYFHDITERKRAEAVLRSNQERQSFLLRLSDALRPLANPVDIQYHAACVLGEHLKANRVGYAEDQGDGKSVAVTQNYTDGVPGITGLYSYDDYGSRLMLDLQSGITVVRDDVTNDETLTDAEKLAHHVLQLGATVNVPLVKDGKLVAIMFVHYREAHHWSVDELELLQETAERTWSAVERARAEAEERSQRMLAEALRDAAAELSSTLELQQVLERGVASARRLLNYDASYIVLTEDGYFTQLQSDNLSEEEEAALKDWHRQFATLDSTPLYKSSAQTGRLLLVNDQGQAEHLLPQTPLHTLFVVPLSHNQTIFGYLVLFNRQSHDITHPDIVTLQAFSYHFVTAIFNARLFIQAQELAALQERQRLARDLHDAVSQTLFAASIAIETLLRIKEKGTPVRLERLEDVHRLIKGAQAEMRTLLLELRPSNVQSTPMSRLLSQLIDAIKGRKRIEIALEFEGEPVLPPEVHLAVYRIVQEALNNITKHSGTKDAWISGRGGDGFIELRVRDAGAGFDTENPKAGLGLQIMRERAAEIGATFEIWSIVGDGTEIHLRWPGTTI
jgi:PAS domain S-box-containing protein